MENGSTSGRQKTPAQHSRSWRATGPSSGTAVAETDGSAATNKDGFFSAATIEADGSVATIGCGAGNCIPAGRRSNASPFPARSGHDSIGHDNHAKVSLPTWFSIDDDENDVVREFEDWGDFAPPFKVGAPDSEEAAGASKHGRPP